MASCCETASDDRAPERCPRCDEKGRPVPRQTVAAMAKLAVPARALARPNHARCTGRTCEVVYFDDTGAVIERKDVRVPVHWKDDGLDVPLCYCFAHTRRSIRDEIDARGASTAFASISAAVKAGECACDVKNPSGTCCLGDIRRYGDVL